MIEELLSEGYGVEDIAIETGHSVSMIRNVVAFLRASGALRDILRKEVLNKLTT